MRTPFSAKRLRWLALLTLVWAWGAFAQEDPNGGGGDPDPPNEEENPKPDPGEGEGPATDGGIVGGGLEALADLRLDLATQGFEVPQTAFEIFPQSVRGEIQTLVTELLPLLALGKEQELTVFFDQQGPRIATVFDQLGLEPSADALLAGPAAATSVKFPDEFENYGAYLDSIDLQPFEREFMLQSHLLAEAYEDDLLEARADQVRLQSALEEYREKLETLNERYAEQFREQFIESIDRAGPDGRRPDVDR